MQEEADRLFPELRDKTAVIYNALNVKAILQRAAETQSAESGDCHVPYILAVERLAESQKDITTLLKAYSLLGDVPEHLVIIGKGKDECKLKDYAASLGLTVSDGMDETARVHFLGFQSNPYVWMSQAAMLVHSAKFEGLPTVLIEALLLGLPIVATDCPVGPREILDGGKAGLLTPVGDVTAMAEAMNNILTDEPLRQQLLAHAKEHSQNFTKEMIKPQLDALLRYDNNASPLAKQG